jgi:hypothetical protein
MSLRPIYPQFTLPFLVFHNFQQSNCGSCLVNSTFTPLSLSCNLSLVWFMKMCSIFKQSLAAKIQTFCILQIALWFSWITHYYSSQHMGPLKCEIQNVQNYLCMGVPTSNHLVMSSTKWPPSFENLNVL